MIEKLQEIREQLEKDELTEEQILAFMSFVRLNYKEFYNDGGINPVYKDKVNSLGVDFDHVNNIVQTILN